MLKQITASLIAGTVGSTFALAQSSPEPPPEQDYTINEPSEDVGVPEAALLQENSEQDTTRRAVERFSLNPKQFTQTDGKDLYETTCQACHMEDGKGAEGAGHYPPLAGNAKLVSKYYILSVLVTGYHGMPRFGDQMDDDQIAAVSNYVRGNLGNAYTDTITSNDVRKLRTDRDE